jgi:ankyrin repeat protein
MKPSLVSGAAQACGVFLILALAGCATPQEKMLNAALNGNDAEIGKLLKQSPADANAAAKVPVPAGPCAGNSTPLQLAVCGGHARVVRALMANKADAGIQNSRGELPLVQASAAGKRDVVQALVEGGAKPNVRDASGRTPLMAAGDAGIVRLLLAGKADPNFTDASGETPLVQASGKGNAAKVSLLLQAGARPNARGNAGQTPLLAAASADIVKLLLDAKADPNFTNAAGQTPLFAAAQGGKTEIARLVLEAGARPNARGPGGLTPLMVAQDAETARTLLAGKADLGSQDQNGDTALLHAARQGKAGVVKALLELGADLEEKNKAGGDLLAAAGAGRDSQTLSVVREAIVKKKLAEADRAAEQGQPAAALAAYVAALPNMAEIGKAQERELRIKILKLAAGMPNPPAVPDAAHEHIVRAEVYLKRGRGDAEVEQELRQALKLAPWWAEGYFNIGLVQGTGNRYSEAIDTLNLFIAGVPAHPDVRKAREKIIEFQISQEEVNKINALAGTWRGNDGATYYVKVSGAKLTLTSGGLTIDANLKTGGAIEGMLQSNAYPGNDNCTIPGQNHPVTGNLDTDGRGMNIEFLWSQYSTRSHCVDMFGNVTFCCLLCSKVCSGVSLSNTNTVRQRLYKR